MKLKLKRKNKGLAFTVKFTGHEELIYAEAETVRMGASQTLFSLTYSQNKKGYDFQYLLGPARRVDEIIKKPLPTEYLEAILLSFLTLVRDCDSHNLSIQRILFRPDYLFFDHGRYSLVFAYVPLRPITENMGSALDALVHLMERIKPIDASAQKLMLAVCDFARRSAFFSWIEYERLLQGLGVLEKKKEEPHPVVQKAVTAPIDCRETFGYDFVNEVLNSSRHDPNGMNGQRVNQDQAIAAHDTYHLIENPTGKTWSLAAGDNEIGTLSAAAITLSNRVGVSRRHANVHVSQDGVFVIDHDSTNGVYVNGKRIDANERMRLRDGDVIHIAREELILRMDQSA